VPEYFAPNKPDIGYNGRDQDQPTGVQIGNSETLRALGQVLAGDQGFENTPDAQDREYTAQVLTAGLSARVQTLEGRMAAGAEYSDNYNRINATSLGSPNPGVVPVWVQFGDGQPLEIIDQAAQLNQSAPFGLVDDGTQYALCPQAASSPNYSVIAIVHPLSKSGKIATRARTAIYGRCNAAGTEGVYVDFWGGHCELGRFTRSGNTVTRTQWKANTERSYSFSSTPELRMKDDRYTVVVDGVELIVHDDVSGFPVDGNHKFSMFSCMTWTGFFGATPEFSAGLTGFAIRGSEFTAIETAQADAGAALEAAQGAQDAIGTVVEDATAAAESAALTIVMPVQNAVNLIQSTAPTKPYSATMNKTQDVTFYRVLLDATPKRAKRPISALDPFVGQETILTSNADGGQNWYTTHVPAYLPPANTVEAAFIPAEYPGPRGTITFITEAVSRSSPCALQVVVGRMRSDGKPVIEWVSPNQTGIMSNSRTEHTVTMPEDLLFDLDEKIWVGIHQFGSGTVRALFGIEYVDIPRAGDLYPPQAKNALSSSVSLSGSVGSVIDTASLSFTSRFLPWIGVGQRFSALVVPRQFIDPFTDAMSSRWSQKSTQPATISGGYFAVSGGNDGVRRYLWSQSLSSDDQSVEGVIGTGVNSKFQRLIIRSNPGNTQYVALTVNSSGVTLDLVSSESYTGLATNAHSVATGTTYRISAIGNLFQVEMKVSGSSIWTVLFTYLDSGNAIPRGERYRYVGIGVERQPFAVNSGNWDSWRAADVEAA
jgi:hypothetical protein